MVFITTVSFAYTFHINGQVISSINNQPVPNHEVVITPADSTNTMLPTITAITGTLGNFEAVIEIQSSATYQYLVYTYGYCQGTSIYYHQLVLCSSAAVTVSFSICDPNVVNPECTAGFSFEIDTASNCAGPGIGYIFNDNSTANSNIISWLWNFSNGTASSDQNPEICLVPGIYEVCLTISTANNCEDNYCQNITVGDTVNVPCEAAFSYIVPQPGIVHFTDLSYGDPVSWIWSFGDGTSSTAQNPGHVYNSTGTYTVCLTIETASGCTDDFCMVVTTALSNNCEAGFEATFTPIECSTCYLFTNTSLPANTGLIYLWNFGDGTVSDTEAPFHEFPATGVYEVCLHITTLDSSCTDVFCMTINVGGTVNYFISGTVYAGIQVVESGIVVLMGTNGSMLSANLGSAGHYEFNNLPAGSYIMYAIPSFILYPDFVPTYYDSALYWADATTINLSSNLPEANIYLIEYSSSNNGTGTISGSILWNSLKNAGMFKDLNDNSVENISIYLLDENNILVNFDVSDIDGNYEFINLPFGTYQVYPELAGYITTPAIITLDESNSAVTGLTIIISGTTITTGIYRPDKGTAVEISVFPNPVQNELNLGITCIKGYIEVRIFNTSGQIIYNGYHDTINNNIDVSAWPSGIYCLEAVIDGSVPVSLRFVK